MVAEDGFVPQGLPARQNALRVAWSAVRKRVRSKGKTLVVAQRRALLTREPLAQIPHGRPPSAHELSQQRSGLRQLNRVSSTTTGPSTALAAFFGGRQ